MSDGILNKVLKEKLFRFFTSASEYTGEDASSLEEFLEKVRVIDSKSLEFHLYRQDFETWFKEALNLEYLAEEMQKIKKLNLRGEELRTQMIKPITNFLEIQKYPPPPEEHAYELKMEKRLKSMLEESKKLKKWIKQKYNVRVFYFRIHNVNYEIIFISYYNN